MNIIDQDKYKNRIPWIDNVKFIAIFCVIFGHFNGLIFTHGRPGFAFVNLLIVVFNMPLFVLMSGYSNFHSLIKIDTIRNLYNYVKKTILHIALPCVIPCIIVWVIQRCNGFVDFKHYWFLVMLFVMQIAAGCCFYISNKIKFLHKNIIAWGLFSLSMIVLSKYSTSELFLYYVLGGALYNSKYKASIYNKSKKVYNPMIFISLSLVALGLFFIVGKYQFYNDTLKSLLINGKFYIWILRILCACIICYLIITLTQMYSKRYNLISYIGSKTLGLYIYTGLMVDVCLKYHLMIHDDSMLSWLTALIISIVATILALVIIRCLESNKITKFCFFGKY